MIVYFVFAQSHDYIADEYVCPFRRGVGFYACYEKPLIATESFGCGCR